METTFAPGISFIIKRWLSMGIALSNVHSMKTRGILPNVQGVTSDMAALGTKLVTAMQFLSAISTS